MKWIADGSYNLPVRYATRRYTIAAGPDGLSLNGKSNLRHNTLSLFTFLSFGVVSMKENRGLMRKSILPNGWNENGIWLVSWAHDSFDNLQTANDKAPFASNENWFEMSNEPTDRKVKTSRGPPIKNGYSIEPCSVFRIPHKWPKAMEWYMLQILRLLKLELKIKLHQGLLEWI